MRVRMGSQGPLTPCPAPSGRRSPSRDQKEGAGAARPADRPSFSGLVGRGGVSGGQQQWQALRRQPRPALFSSSPWPTCPTGNAPASRLAKPAPSRRARPAPSSPWPTCPTRNAPAFLRRRVLCITSARRGEPTRQSFVRLNQRIGEAAPTCAHLRPGGDLRTSSRRNVSRRGVTLPRENAADIGRWSSSSQPRNRSRHELENLGSRRMSTSLRVWKQKLAAQTGGLRRVSSSHHLRRRRGDRRSTPYFSLPSSPSPTPRRARPPLPEPLLSLNRRSHQTAIGACSAWR
eukprot:COSAG04_NODE_5196_length_1705_cov_2.225405_2_plen_289_part_00